MNRVDARSERYLQIERLLLTSREPLSKAKIARRTGVNRSTVGRMEAAMAEMGIPISYDDQMRLYIDRTNYLSTIRLKLDEAVVLYLATRLLARYSDKPNTHVTHLLEKLGASVNGVAPAVADHIIATSSSLKSSLPATPVRDQTILEVLGKGWAESQVVQITYRPLRARRSFEQPFEPYFLEPSEIGFGVYAIGNAGTPGVIRTRKLDQSKRLS